ncbi:MAG: c-type cytochrome [Blastocatellia bacterium]
MSLPIRLTHRPRVVFLCFLLGSSLLALACHKSSVTEVANAGTSANANASPSATPNATDTPPTAIPGQPGASPNPGAIQFGPDGRAVAVGVAPDYKAGQATPTPAPGISTKPAASPTIQHLDNGKMVIVQGKNLPPEMMGPPPTPTPTPAPTPVVEMVNGKVKQKWEAPAEAASVKSPLKVNADVVKKGKYLYENRCSICHGSEGKGNGPYNDPKWTQSTNLASKAVQANTDGELFYKISTSRDRHPASKVLYTEEERWMVVAFLRTLK